MEKDTSFIVRTSKEQLTQFNEKVKESAANRAELFRKWMQEYIEGERS